jgi:hypothetical protein
MSECLPDLPSHVRQRGDEWQGADHPDGPWRPIPAPQSGLPWRTDAPAVLESREPASVVAEVRPLSPADRLALALCHANSDIGQCAKACEDCRFLCAAVTAELAAILRERYGSSATADWLDGVGAHP